MSGATEIASGSTAAREACDLMGDRRFTDIVLTDLEGAAPLSDAVLVRLLRSSATASTSGTPAVNRERPAAGEVSAGSAGATS